MNGKTISRTAITKIELDALVKAVTEAHRALEASGNKGSEEFRRLYGLEDKLGSLQGSTFSIEGKD